LTADLDRLIGFYERVLDARVVLDLEEEGLRHAFIELGATTVLHPFEVPGVDVPQEQIPMFQPGRLDHIALNAPSEGAFRELYRRVVEEDAAAGPVSDIGGAWLFTFIDPDGAGHEVVWTHPGCSPADCLPRAQWTTVPLESTESRAGEPAAASVGPSR
jgi:catechol 2,3-dioxygenase-like lactoylglutathione lyase family enzyme